MSPEAYAAALARAGEAADWQQLERVTRIYAWHLFRRELRDAARRAWRGGVRLGPLLPLAGMALGLAFQGLAATAFGLIPGILIATLVFGILGMPALSIRAAFCGGTLLLVLGLGTVTPLLGWLLAGLLGASAEERVWVALASAAPVGSAALGGALALGFSAVLTAGAILASLLALPLTLPLTAWLLGAAAGIEPVPMAQRLLLLAALPALVATAVRPLPVLAHPPIRRRCAEVALFALTLLAMARMHGIAETIADDPGAALHFLTLAMLPTLAGLLTVLLVLRRLGGMEAMVAGGFRNVALVWVAVVTLLPPEGHLFMALTALPIYATPALVHLLLRARQPRTRGAKG
jgi:hypothetical protein